MRFLIAFNICCGFIYQYFPWAKEGMYVFYSRVVVSWYQLQWRHNGRFIASNHQPHDFLLNRLFRHRSKKTSKLRVTGLCVGNSSGTGEFPAQMASNAENDSIWWRHHDYRFQERVLHIYVHTLLPVTGRLQGAAYLVYGTYLDGAWLRLTRSSQHIREDMHATLMEVALEWKWDVELYILHSWDSRGLLIYCLWMCTLLKKSACYKLCSPLL